MIDSWVVLLPALIVLILALTLRNVQMSLFVGIITAAFLATHFSLGQSLIFIARNLYHQLMLLDHLYTFGFLILLGILIELMTHTGGIAAYTKVIKSHLSTAQSAETASLLLSCTFFVDDYLNSLTVGSIMRPVTDYYKIPRAKLAFLIDSMSSPLCVLVPATSWLVVILSQMNIAGIQNSFEVYLNSIPLLFYPLFILFSAWFIVRFSISFGTMQKFERQAHEGNLFGSHRAAQMHITPLTKMGSLADFLFPIGLFITTVIICFLYSGGFFLFGGKNSFFLTLQNAQSSWSLFVAILITVICSNIYFMYYDKIKFKDIMHATKSGFLLMKNSILLLLLAWTFGTILKDDLHAGTYLAHLLIGAFSIQFLPATIFATTMTLAAITGSAWGTIALMIPLALPLVSGISLTLLYACLAAILAGAVAGGHFSPISDSTVISSTSAGCYHLDHVRTQISYAFPALIGSLISFLISGFTASYSYVFQVAISLCSGFACTILLLIVRNFAKK